MKFDLSFVLPCLNEEETLQKCIQEISDTSKVNGWTTEIIVADNGSTDNSCDIAIQLGAVLVRVPEKGYGAAIRGGVNRASAEFVLVADSDFSYDFSQAPTFVKQLNLDSDLVVGNRFRGRIEKDAMPWLHRYLGNPVLSWIARRLFDVPLGDFHCGMRAFKKSSFMLSKPTTTGMEFATEMIVKFAQAGAKISEVPTNLRKDGRSRKPHLRSFPDGWRHLKLMLLYSPMHLQVIPGLLLLILGLYGVTSYASLGQINLGFLNGGLQTALLSLSGISIGLQLMVSGALNTEYAGAKALSLKKISIIQAIFRSKALTYLALSAIALGVMFVAPLSIRWYQSGYSFVSPDEGARVTVITITLFIAGFQLLIGALHMRQFRTKFW